MYVHVRVWMRRSAFGGILPVLEIRLRVMNLDYDLNVVCYAGCLRYVFEKYLPTVAATEAIQRAA